jgi:signal transduction histidine kinase
VPGLLVAGTEVAYALALLGNPAETPVDPVFSSIFLARSSAVACLAVGVAWSAVRAWRTRTAVSRFAAELGEAPAPGSLRAVLARTVGDPGLQVAYWLPESERYVDGSGEPVDSLQAGGRTATPIVRQGKEVAVLIHDATTLDATDLERQIGPAARLAVENERLQAELLAQLDDLRASRARIVERADAERRRLERDLHDGAQQRLLALTYELRRARAGVRNDDDEDASLLAAATGEAQEILADLRELAHGIFPAVLTEAGLGAALQTLADGAALPVELEQVTDGRYPGPVETGAYLAVAEAIEDARRRNATHARVGVARYGDRLAVEVRDDGDERSSTMAAVTDRVWALGGRLEVGPTGLRAEIPCA